MRGEGEDRLLDRRDDEAVEVVDLHEPISREMSEPRDGYEPPPTWLLFFCLAVMGFGGWYLGMYSGGFDPSQYDETGWRMRSDVGEVAPLMSDVDPMVLGTRIYNNCAACHQRDGRGVAGNYPPLDGSRWVSGPAEPLAALLLHGLQGEIEVQGVVYDQVMPRWSHLSDSQIAAVLTYIRSAWSNDAPPVAPELVASIRAATGDRSQPWTSAALDEFASSVVVTGTDGPEDDDAVEG